MLRICVKFAIEAVVDLRQSIGDNSHSQTGNQSQQPQHFAALEWLMLPSRNIASIPDATTSDSR